MIALVMAAMLVGAVAVVEFGLFQRLPPPPSIVLVVLDTVRADRVDLERQDADAPTPFLAGLAADGLVCARARAPANWTLPSHASIFTGLLPSEHGCHFEHRFLAEEADTLAEFLRERGYVTAAFSSNVNVSKAFNLDQGFDWFYEAWTDPAVASGRSKSVALREALNTFLQRSDWKVRERPLFLFVNLMDAHLPYDAPPEHLARVGHGAAELDRGELDAADFFDRVVTGERPLDPAFLTALDARYRAAVRAADDQLAAVCGVLRSNGVLDDATLIVTSDHGENLGEHGLVDHQGSLHETVLRVPLVLHGSQVKPGTVIEQPVAVLDLFRWIQDLQRHDFDPPGASSLLTVVAERQRPWEVLDRLARSHPSFDPGPIAERETVLVFPESRWKLHRRETRAGAEDRLLRLEDDGPVPKGAAEPDDLAEYVRRLDMRLAQRRPVREMYEAEKAASPAGDELWEELAQTGYLGAEPAAAPPSVHAHVHFDRGNRAYQAGDVEAAHLEYTRATKLQPSFAMAWFNLAVTTERLAPEAAYDVWERYLKAAHAEKVLDQERIQEAYARQSALR